jgi:hypothetical protein
LKPPLPVPNPSLANRVYLHEKYFFFIIIADTGTKLSSYKKTGAKTKPQSVLHAILIPVK